MPQKDNVGFGDGLEATIATPEDSYEEMTDLDVIERRGEATIPHTVKQVDNGYGVYVSWQEAPLTVRNITFSLTADEAEANFAAYLATVTQAQVDQAFGRPA